MCPVKKQTTIKLLLREATIPDLEKQHREGYAKHPVAEGEFREWESEHTWDDEIDLSDMASDPEI